MRTYLSIVAVLVVLAITAACGGTSSGDKTKTAAAGKPSVAATLAPAATAAASPATTAVSGTAIKVSAKDFAFALDKSSGPAGSFTFTATNTGPTDHEFVVFKTDLAPDKLPLVADKSKVDEHGDGVLDIDEIENLNISDTKSLTVTLEPGAYVFVCNLPAHYSQGMYTAFTVK